MKCQCITVTRPLKTRTGPQGSLHYIHIIIQHIPFMSIRYEDGGSLHNPPLYLPLQLFVHHHHLIGTQLGHISHCDGVHLQLVLEHLEEREGGTQLGHISHCDQMESTSSLFWNISAGLEGGRGGGSGYISSPRHH